MNIKGTFDNLINNKFMLMVYMLKFSSKIPLT